MTKGWGRLFEKAIEVDGRKLVTQRPLLRPVRSDDCSHAERHNAGGGQGPQCYGDLSRHAY